MNRWLLLAAALASLPVAAQGGVISRDWKTPGDGLLTYDDVNKREWLDLSQSLLSKFPGSTREERYLNVVSELSPGHLFDGFVVATRGDVIALAESGGVNTSIDDFATNIAPIETLIDLLEPTLSFASNRIMSRGYLSEITQPTPFDPPHRLFAVFDIDVNDSPFISRASLRFATGSDFNDPSTYGAMLYRQIPEPSALILALMSVGMMVVRRASS